MAINGSAYEAKTQNSTTTSVVGHIGRSGRRTPNLASGSPRPDQPSPAQIRRAELIARTKATALRCHSLCAALRTAATDDERRLLKRFLKASARPELRNEHQLGALDADLLVFEEHLTSRVSALGPSPEHSRSESVTAVNPAQSATKARRNKTTLPIPLADLPSVADLDRVEKPFAEWADLLEAPWRERPITLQEMESEPALLAEYTLRVKLLELRGTMSAAEATAQVQGCTPKRHEVRRTQRWWRSGASLDQRRTRMTAARVMVPLVQLLTLKFYMGRRRASSKQIAKLVNTELATLELRAREAGYENAFPRATAGSIKRFLGRIPESVAVVRKEGIGGWSKNQRLVDQKFEATHANHIWQIDHTPLDIFVVKSAEEPDTIVTPMLTTCIDSYSGMPMAAFISSVTPDAYTTSIVLATAIRPRKIGAVDVGGLPEILRPDHGTDFMSSHVSNIAKALPITLDPAKERTPDEKAKVERFMRTVNQLIAEFPGHKGANGRSLGAGVRRRRELLTMRQLIEKLPQLIDDYAQEVAAGLGSSPLTRYAESVDIRLPSDMQDLDLLLLKTDQERTLTREGVRFQNRRYKARFELPSGHMTQDLTGRRVVIRYHPYSLESIYVYDSQSGARLGEFFEEKQWREMGLANESNRAYIAPLKERTSEFTRRVQKQDIAAAKEAREKERADIKASKETALEPQRMQMPVLTATAAGSPTAVTARQRSRMADILD